jgi:hypothetical protein
MRMRAEAPMMRTIIKIKVAITRMATVERWQRYDHMIRQ